MPSNRIAPASTGANPDDLLGGGVASDLTAEFAVIGALVLAAQRVQDEVLGIVQEDDFTDPRCRFTIGAVRRMRAEGLPVDMLTLTGFVQRHGLLAGGAPRVALASWLHEMTCAAPVPASAPWYADLVVEQSARQRARWAATAIADAADDGALADLQTIVTDESATVLAAIARVGGGDDA